MLKLLLSIITLILLITASSSLNMQCDYGNGSYPTLGRLYRCIVLNNLNINSQDTATIESATGTHLDGKTDDDLNAIHISDKNVEFFPRGLETIFKNLRHIHISYDKLKHVQQVDLKPFPKLAHLELNSNKIQALEDGIFDLNPELEVVWFSANRIYHVGADVFKNLNNVKWIGFSGNRCIDMEARGDPVKVKEVVEALKVKCN